MNWNFVRWQLPLERLEMTTCDFNRDPAIKRTIGCRPTFFFFLFFLSNVLISICEEAAPAAAVVFRRCCHCCRCRNRMALLPSQAFYLLVNNSGLASMTLSMAQVYGDHQDDDGFLYMTYASQEMFGQL